MCDYSLQNVRSRAARVGDRLVTKNFGTGTRGFASTTDEELTAVCILPGTEIAFDEPFKAYQSQYIPGQSKRYTTLARFRRIDNDNPHAHHDALEIPNGEVVLLTLLAAGQMATVLQLPAKPKTEAEAEEQRRAEYV